MLVFFLRLGYWYGAFISAGSMGRWGSGTDIADTKGRGHTPAGKIYCICWVIESLAILQQPISIHATLQIHSAV